MNRPPSQAGFTTVELLVTILVTASFIASISQMIGFVGSVALDAHRREIASNLAYNNLRLYANGQKPGWFDCIGDTTGETAPYTDGKKYPNSTGKAILTITTAVADLPSPVTQKVTVLAPYGCGASASAMPIRITSTVTYGSPAKEVVHATYVTGY